jgi:hypothetical protein
MFRAIGWSHIAAEGTHRAVVTTYPWSGLPHGAEGYLRHLARRPGVVAARLQQVLDESDARAGRR